MVPLLMLDLLLRIESRSSLDMLLRLPEQRTFLCDVALDLIQLMLTGLKLLIS